MRLGGREMTYAVAVERVQAVLAEDRLERLDEAGLEGPVDDHPDRDQQQGRDVEEDPGAEPVLAQAGCGTV